MSDEPRTSFEPTQLAASAAFVVYGVSSSSSSRLQQYRDDWRQWRRQRRLAADGRTQLDSRRKRTPSRRYRRIYRPSRAKPSRTEHYRCNPRCHRSVRAYLYVSESWSVCRSASGALTISFGQFGEEEAESRGSSCQLTAIKLRDMQLCATLGRSGGQRVRRVRVFATIRATFVIAFCIITPTTLIAASDCDAAAAAADVSRPRRRWVSLSFIKPGCMLTQLSPYYIAVSGRICRKVVWQDNMGPFRLYTCIHLNQPTGQKD